MPTLSKLICLDVVLLSVGSWTLYRLTQTLRSRVKTTELDGPPSTSWLFGVTREIFRDDSGALYEDWAKEYGPVYQIPAPFGGRRVILTDPKAISHFYSRESFTYVQNKFMRRSIESLVR